MSPQDKPIFWLRESISTPPFSQEARREAGHLLRLLQKGRSLSLPHSRPMPEIGPRCHELRINDANGTWRIIYRVDALGVIIAHVFAKKTTRTPEDIMDICKRRLRHYDAT